MSMTTVNAKIYVSRIIGGAASQEAIDMAGEAILRGYQDWQNKKFWRFLLKDTSAATVVTGFTVGTGVSTITAPASTAIDFVNKGQLLAKTAGTAVLPAGTYVGAITRNTDGTIQSFTLVQVDLTTPAVTTGTADTSGTGTISFSANIPVITGVNDYNLPTDYQAPFTAQLIINPRTLVWRDQRYWDRVIVDQTVPGTPSEYTSYNSYSELSQNFGTTHLKFDRTPDVTDTLLLRYFRKFNTSGTNIDMTDDFLYQFLDYCANLLLQRKVAADNPQAYNQGAMGAQESAAENDEQPTDDDDADQCMKSQYEMGNWNRPLWGNGAFDPYR